MANGIRLSRLRRQIKSLHQEAPGSVIASAWNETPGRGLSPWLLDTTYRALPKPLWDSVLQHMGISEFDYKSQRSDCDDFAFAMRGRVPLELRVNGIAAVLDWSGKHAYNALVYTEGGGFHVAFIEPQAPDPSSWWISRPGGEGMYDMDNGVAIF